MEASGKVLCKYCIVSKKLGSHKSSASNNEIILRKSLQEVNKYELKNSITEFNAKLNFIKDLFDAQTHLDAFVDEVFKYFTEVELKNGHGKRADGKVFTHNIVYKEVLRN